jgi:hypothetical protein
MKIEDIEKHYESELKRLRLINEHQEKLRLLEAQTKKRIRRLLTDYLKTKLRDILPRRAHTIVRYY